MDLSTKYGIPRAVIINDQNRHPACDAHEATLIDVSPDGKTATYKGACNVGHHYSRTLDVQELKSKTRAVIVNGELVYEHEDKVKNTGENELEEY